MKDLNRAYKRKTNELEVKTEELEKLKQYKSVKRYLELEEKIKSLNSDLKDLYKKLLLKRYANCDHILVMSDYEIDYTEGRSYHYYGCIKCGLNEAVANRGYGRNEEERNMLDLMNEHKVYKIFGKRTDVECELEDAKELYNDIIANDKDLSDDEIVDVFKAMAKAKKLTLRR